MSKKVIVTGGAGFLGSHLVPALVEKGFDVHVIDNLVAGKRENVPKKATLHVIDVSDRKALGKVFKDISEVYGLFHLAALPRVQFSIDNPEEAHKTNVEGTLNVFLASRGTVRRIVYSASSAAYGDQDVLPLKESMLPKPMSPYALHKYFGEHLAKNVALHYGVETVSLRYFNIYGPNADPNGPYAQAIIKFIDQRKKGMPLTVTGDGLQTRDSVHVRDVVRANILALESKNVGRGEMMNIGSGRNVSVLDMAKMIGSPITHIAPRIEPHDTRADITLAKKLIGWEPEVTLEEGIAELKNIHSIAD